MKPTITKLLMCPLSAADLRDRGASLAETVDILRKLRDEKRDLAKRLSDREKDASSEALRLSRIITEKQEHRAIDCREIADTDTWIIVVQRLDTGEVVETRPMTETERRAAQQLELPVRRGEA